MSTAPWDDMPLFEQYMAKNNREYREIGVDRLYRYTPPEVILGEPALNGPRSDLEDVLYTAQQALLTKNKRDPPDRLKQALIVAAPRMLGMICDRLYDMPLNERTSLFGRLHQEWKAIVLQDKLLATP